MSTLASSEDPDEMSHNATKAEDSSSWNFSLNPFQAGYIMYDISPNNLFYYITYKWTYLIGPDANPLKSIKLHITWAAGFPNSILVTKYRLHRNFP